MAVAFEGQDVATKTGHGGERPGAGRPKAARDDISVKIDRSVAAKAMYLARLRGKSLADFLTELVKPSVERDFAKASREEPNN